MSVSNSGIGMAHVCGPFWLGVKETDRYGAQEAAYKITSSFLIIEWELDVNITIYLAIKLNALSISHHLKIV